MLSFEDVEWLNFIKDCGVRVRFVKRKSIYCLRIVRKRNVVILDQIRKKKEKLGVETKEA